MWSCLSLQCSKTGLVPYVWDIMFDIFGCSQVDRHMIRVWWFRGSVSHKGIPYWWCVALTTGFTWKQSWGSLFRRGLRYCVACKVQFWYIGNIIKIKVFCLYLLYIGKKKRWKKVFCLYLYMLLIVFIIVLFMRISKTFHGFQLILCMLIMSF